MDHASHAANAPGAVTRWPGRCNQCSLPLPAVATQPNKMMMAMIPTLIIHLLHPTTTTLHPPTTNVRLPHATTTTILHPTLIIPERRFFFIMHEFL